jgi:hypothetical protein
LRRPHGLQWSRGGAINRRASALSSRASYEQRTRATKIQTRVDTRRLILDWMMARVTMLMTKQLTAMSRWRLIHRPKLFESAEIVRVAAFPSPQVVEREDPTEVDWEAALPPRDRWPADLDKTYTPAILLVRERGLRSKRQCIDWCYTMLYVICHLFLLILSAMARCARRAGSRAHAHAAHAPRCLPTLPLPFASAYQTVGPRPTGLNMGRDLSVLTREGTSHRSYGTTALKRPGEPVLTREQGPPTAPSGPRT